MNLALFDLDHTLLPLDSDQAWGEFSLYLGWVDRDSFKAKNDAFYADYQAGCLDIHDYVRFSTAAVRQRGHEAANTAHEQFMAQVIRPAMMPAALALVNEHRRRGDSLVMVTATNEFVTRPIAQAFGMDVLLAVELERDAQGHFTGEIQGVPSLREGKVTRVEQWLVSQGLTLADVQSTFYSDSINDLPLLEKVQTPVVTNGSPALRQIAVDRGWRILDLFENP
ncbi:MAG: HAD family hydrolase [Betaproteobacteria bacterium]|nr:HAD family hydrolase [Betaproteobacteria bacterium]